MLVFFCMLTSCVLAFSQEEKYLEIVMPEKVRLGMPAIDLDRIRAGSIRIPSVVKDKLHLGEKQTDRLERDANGRAGIYYIRNDVLAGYLLSVPIIQSDGVNNKLTQASLTPNKDSGLIFDGERDVVRSNRDMVATIAKARHWHDAAGKTGVFVVSTATEVSVYLYQSDVFDADSFFAPPASIERLTHGMDAVRQRLGQANSKQRSEIATPQSTITAAITPPIQPVTASPMLSSNRKIIGGLIIVILGIAALWNRTHKK